MSDLLLKQAEECRDAAGRARELAGCVSLDGDRVRLMRLAQQQEARATELEAKARVFAGISEPVK